MSTCAAYDERYEAVLYAEEAARFCTGLSYLRSGWVASHEALRLPLAATRGAVGMEERGGGLGGRKCRGGGGDRGRGGGGVSCSGSGGGGLVGGGGVGGSGAAGGKSGGSGGSGRALGNVGMRRGAKC